MARFNDSPPTDGLPRMQMELPEQAARPEDFTPPDVDAPVGPPDGLPSIPVLAQPENFPDPFPEEAEDAVAHMPWV